MCHYVIEKITLCHSLTNSRFGKVSKNLERKLNLALPIKFIMKPFVDYSFVIFSNPHGKTPKKRVNFKGNNYSAEKSQILKEQRGTRIK